jgi:hypothetical protein
MAKDQDLPLNPQKISGLCGRLLCCLSYEDEGYREMRKSLPKIGQRCSTPTGEGRVVAVNVLRRQVTLVVDGMRVEVPDRDLGLVVRWDPASKAADPPPSISRADAIAQGLIEATEEDLHAAELAAAPAGDWLSADTPLRDPGPGRGRLPGGGPRKQGRPRPQPGVESQGRGTERPQQRQPGPPRPRDPQSPSGPRRERADLPAGRVFQRSQPPSLPADGATPPPAEGDATSPRRRRGRRGGRGRGPGPSPTPE